MTMSDPIADMLTRIRNSILRQHDKVSIPSSLIKANIAKVLKDEGFIVDYQEHINGIIKTLEITLKYDKRGESVIRKINRVNKPGYRVFRAASEMKSVLNGQGIYIITTSQGVMSDLTCKTQNVGGEVLCEVY